MKKLFIFMVAIIVLSAIFGKDADTKNTKENKTYPPAIAGISGELLKKSLRDPDSLVVTDAFYKEDGSVACILYRAKNGFGGYTSGVFVMTDEMKIFTSVNDYNKRCTGFSDYKNFKSLI